MHVCIHSWGLFLFMQTFHLTKRLLLSVPHNSTSEQELKQQHNLKFTAWFTVLTDLPFWLPPHQEPASRARSKLEVCTQKEALYFDHPGARFSEHSTTAASHRYAQNITFRTRNRFVSGLTQALLTLPQPQQKAFVTAHNRFRAFHDNMNCKCGVAAPCIRDTVKGSA